MAYLYQKLESLITAYGLTKNVITGFKRSSTVPSGSRVVNIAADGSPYVINAYIADNIIYYQTNATKVKTSATSLYQLFFGYTALTDISGLADLDISSSTTASNMFNGCTSLSDLSSLTNWNTSNITNMESMLRSCSSITNVDALADWDVSNVTTFMELFYNCSTLADIYGLKDWDTSSVQLLYATFGNCSSLHDFSPLLKWDATNVTNMTSTFYNTGLYDLSALNKWRPNNVTTFNYTFANCSGLGRATICLDDWGFTRSGTDLKNANGATIDEYNPFYGCSFASDVSLQPIWEHTAGYTLTLETIALSRTDFRYALESIGEAILGNYENYISRIEMTKTAAAEGTDTYRLDGSGGTAYEYLYAYLDQTNGNVVKIYYNHTGYDDVRFTIDSIEELFKIDYEGGSLVEDTNLSKHIINVSVLNNFVEDQVFSSAYGLFYWCLDLTDISPLSVCTPTLTTKVSRMFYDCNKIKNLDPLSYCSFALLDNIEYAFYNCLELEDISPLSTWSMNLTSTLLRYIFSGCSSLSDISVLGDHWKNISIADSNAEGVFKGCSSLKDISLISYWDLSSPLQSPADDMTEIFTGTGVEDFTCLDRWTCLHFNETDKKVYNGDVEIVGLLNSVKSCNPAPNKYPSWAKYVPTMNSVQLVSIDVLETAFRHVTQSDLSLITAIQYATDDASSYIDLKDPSDTSSYVIHMWYDNGIIYFYSTARIKAPETLRELFSKFVNLEDIQGLTFWDTSEVKSMAYMFANTKISNVSPLTKWRTDAIEDMTGMFQYCSQITNFTSLERKSYTDVSGTYTAWNLESTFDEHGNRYVHNKAKTGEPQIAVSNIFFRTGVTSESNYPNWWTEEE